MDMVGDGGCVITTWDGWVHTGLGGTSSRTGGFIGNGCLPMRSGGVALGNIGEGLVAGLRLKDMRSGVSKEG